MTNKQIEDWLQHGRNTRRIVIETCESRFIAVAQEYRYKTWKPIRTYNTGTGIISALHLLDLED